MSAGRPCESPAGEGAVLLHLLVEDLGFFVTWEVLQLQRLLGEEGDSQVEVVVPQLGQRDGESVAWKE